MKERPRVVITVGIRRTTVDHCLHNSTFVSFTRTRIPVCTTPITEPNSFAVSFPGCMDHHHQESIISIPLDTKSKQPQRPSASTINGCILVQGFFSSTLLSVSSRHFSIVYHAKHGIDFKPLWLPINQCHLCETKSQAHAGSVLVLHWVLVQRAYDRMYACCWPMKQCFVCVTKTYFVQYMGSQSTQYLQNKSRVRIAS